MCCTKFYIPTKDVANKLFVITSRILIPSMIYTEILEMSKMSIMTLKSFTVVIPPIQKSIANLS